MGGQMILKKNTASFCFFSRNKQNNYYHRKRQTQLRLEARLELKDNKVLHRFPAFSDLNDVNCFG
jgi:hypothetical protein